MAIKEIISELPEPKTLSDKAHYSIIALLEKGFKPLEHGRHRAGYASKNYVYKVPLNREGVQDNLSEAKQYRDNGGRLNCKRHSHLINIAKCRIIYIYDGLPILVMEKVTPLADRLITMMFGVTKDGTYHPFEWIDSLDSEQAGFNKMGILVAYDYAAFLECLGDYGSPEHDKYKELCVSEAALTRYGNRKIFGRDHSD